MSEPLPVYPELEVKAASLKVLMAESLGKFTDRHDLQMSILVGGLVRVWLYAQVNGETNDFIVTGWTARDVDMHAGLDGLASAMIAKGWLRVRTGSIDFPGLKQYRKERTKAAWDKTLEDAGTAKLAWFETFWEAYVPTEGKSKGPKQPALAEWLRIGGLTADLAREITDATKRHSKSGWKVLNGYTCHARRYLHQRMWQDAPPARPGADSHSPAKQAGPPRDDRGLFDPTGQDGACVAENANTEPVGAAPSILARTGRTRGIDTTGPAPAAE